MGRPSYRNLRNEKRNLEPYQTVHLRCNIMLRKGCIQFMEWKKGSLVASQISYNRKRPISSWPTLSFECRTNQKTEADHPCYNGSAIGAENTILIYLTSAGVLLALVMGCGSRLIVDSAAGILNNLLIPRSTATTYSSCPLSLHATLYGDRCHSFSLSLMGISTMDVFSGNSRMLLTTMIRFLSFGSEGCFFFRKATELPEGEKTGWELRPS